MPANTNILNKIPFGDKVLKSTITRLDYETPEVTNYIATAVNADPETDPVTLLSYEILYPYDKPFELNIEAVLKLTNDLSSAADQEFVIDLFDVEEDAAWITLATLDVDVLYTDPVLVKVNCNIRSKDTSNSKLIVEYTVVPDATAISSVTGGVTVPDIQELDLPTGKVLNLLVTAETGTASTDVQLINGKISLDKRVWN